MAIIIKKPVLKRTDKIVVPTKKKVLFDVETALEPEPEMPYELVQTEKPTANVDFSWEERELEELKKEATPQAEEYVAVIVNEEKKVDWFKRVINYIVAMLFGAAVVVGGKTGYDALNEIDALQKKNAQLEQELSSKDKPPISAGVETPAAPVVPLGTPENAFVKILNSKSHYLLVERADSQVELRTGGTVEWRLNNPGKFGYGDFSKETGAIGKYSKYAIFPTEAAGKRALEIYLFNTDRYSKLTVDEAMIKFFGKGDKATSIAKKISVALNRSRFKTSMGSLTDDQRKKVLNVILENNRALKGETRIYKNLSDWKKRGF